jgi:Short C-terminal domain
MFRRRVVFGRPRLLGAALIGGLGFAAGRASRSASGGRAGFAANAQPDITARLRELSDMHAAGSLTDEEFAAAKAKLLVS